ncbi:MAG: hypothetical protein GY795_47065 [Desulfobacterales bacterium]|nr:hypothetical protein [Desulfobacterales bacterium]
MILEKESGKSLVVTWIIWAAMFMSLAIYVLICHLIGDEIRSGSIEVPASHIRLVKYILVAVSAAEVVIAYFIRRFMLTRKVAATSLKERYTSAVLISLAFSESIGIFGMVLYFVDDSLPTLYSFIGISALAMVFYRPKADEFEKFCSQA